MSNLPIDSEANSESPQDRLNPILDPKYQCNPRVRVDFSPIHGLGLFANVDLPAFTRVGRYEGEITQEDGMHVLWLYDEQTESWYGIDGDNEMRFLNHSDNPNAEWSDVELFTVRWINAGEEITFDYGWGDEESPDLDEETENIDLRLRTMSND